jgi:hypothetical protein
LAEKKYDEEKTERFHHRGNRNIDKLQNITQKLGIVKL